MQTSLPGPGTLCVLQFEAVRHEPLPAFPVQVTLQLGAAIAGAARPVRLSASTASIAQSAAARFPERRTSVALWISALSARGPMHCR
jgi:hypothetical protein